MQDIPVFQIEVFKVYGDELRAEKLKVVTHADHLAHVASQQAELERLRGALNYCVVLDNLYVGQDFTDNPQGSDAAHLRDIWRQMIEHVDCVLNLPSDAALNPPAAESGDGK